LSISTTLEAPLKKAQCAASVPTATATTCCEMFRDIHGSDAVAHQFMQHYAMTEAGSCHYRRCTTPLLIIIVLQVSYLKSIKHFKSCNQNTSMH